METDAFLLKRNIFDRLKLFMKFILLFALIFSFLFHQADAQVLGSIDPTTVNIDDLSDQQIMQVWNRAQQENMDIEEVVSFATVQGLPAAEASKLRSRLNDARASGNRDEQSNGSASRDLKLSEDEVENIVPDSAIEISHSTVQTSNSSNGGSVPIYGHSIFTDQTLNVFTTTDAARAPDSYVLGSEDQIRITIFGQSQADLQLEVSPDGYVQSSGIPRIFLKGLTIREARQLLYNRLHSFYTFESDEIAITIKVARTINVNIFGEVQTPGGFNVSALNSAFNVLTASGGPTNLGTVRQIQLIRESERKIIDVYSLLNDPSVQENFQLFHNDIIFVPLAEKVVDLRGAVKRPMKYELLEQEGLLELVEYAGGINYDTALGFVQVERIKNGEPVLQEWSLADILNKKEKVTLMDGDIIRIREVGRELENFVEIEGSVFYPGRYNLSQSSSLITLLERAELRPQAMTNLIFIERIMNDESERIIPVEYDKLLEEGNDIELFRRDNVIIFNQERYRNVANVRVNGNVRNPIERTLHFDERITIENALDLAGGLRPTASETAFIFRQNLFNTDIVEHIRVDLIKDATYELQPGDELRVYNQASYSDIGEISVRGAVNESVNTTYDSNLRVSDLLTIAGGFSRGANLNRLDIFRLDLSFREGTNYDVITLKADSLMNIVDAPQGFQLQPFDRLVVRRIPEFNIGASIDLNGEVLYPGNYPLKSRITRVSDIIEEAGGLTSTADPQNAVIMRTEQNVGPIAVNLRRALSNPGSNRHDPIILEDDVITIPKESNTVTIRVNATRLGEMQDVGVVDLDTAVREINRVNVVYQGSKSAKWYIKNFAGGFAEDANKWSVTVTKPNGEVQGTNRRMIFFRNYPSVEPGSTIALRVDPPEPEDDKPLIDWERIQARTTSAATTILTLLILADRL